MTLELFPKRRKKLVIEPLDNMRVQLDWIAGIQEQVDWANNPVVLPDYILQLRVAKRSLEP